MEVDIDLSALEIQSQESELNVVIEEESPSVQCQRKEDEVGQVRRSGRTKIRPADNSEKRRVFTRPRKLTINNSAKEVESYYLDKKVKIFSPALETIFEEPKKGLLMGTRKLRRFINFSDVVCEKPDKNKVRKRSMKAKKLNGCKKFGKKVGLELVMSKLKDLEGVAS